ncbi:MAG: glycosyltransferase family 2 protein [Rhodospirillales bacterium]|nr:glycosyltransferase family 2 protein [Rhodospirillales bacterium]
MPERPFTLSIVVPVYNGAATVGELVEALAGLSVPGGHEIVLVVDGSPDDSLAVCRALTERIAVPLTVVDHARNFGEHNAVMTGLRHARGDYVVTMDDDLQNPPSEVLRLLEHAQRTGADAVYTYYAEKQHAAWRNLGSRFTNRVADWLLDKPRGLYLSSFRLLSAFVVEQVTRYDGPFPYIDGLVMQTTTRLERLAVKHLPRAAGRSNYTFRRLVRLWLNMFLNFSVMPLRVSTLTGFVLSILGVIGVLSVLIEALFDKTPEGWASVMAAVLLLSGVQLMILGMVGEYLGRLYLTANRKPQAIVRAVHRNRAACEAGEAAARDLSSVA